MARGFAWIKFSGSVRRVGKNRERPASMRRKIQAPRRSLIE